MNWRDIFSIFSSAGPISFLPSLQFTPAFWQQVGVGDTVCLLLDAEEVNTIKLVAISRTAATNNIRFFFFMVKVLSWTKVFVKMLL